MGVLEVIAVAGAIVGALASVVVKLYLDLAAERSRSGRDLRHVAGLPTSIDPPTITEDEQPPTKRSRPPPRKRR
jgi:hypothetical protein